MQGVTSTNIARQKLYDLFYLELKRVFGEEACWQKVSIADVSKYFDLVPSQGVCGEKVWEKKTNFNQLIKNTTIDEFGHCTIIFPKEDTGTSDNGEYSYA